MAISALNFARERLRQTAMDDSDFFKKVAFYFELRIPEAWSPDVVGTYFFPLMVNPESYSMDEPFTLEETMTQGGGLYVEENGIVRRSIRLSGHTGFKPRQLAGVAVVSLAALAPEKKSFGRALPPTVLDNISGQRHFQYLQDAVFRTYGDFKRDPATAEKTELIFHNPKDREHWLVAPVSFKLQRDKGRPQLWTYDIELLVLDKAEDANKDFSEDKPLLDQMKDGLRWVKSGIDLAAGAVNDLTAIAADIENLVSDLGKIIGGVGTVIDAATDFVEGVSDLIQSPLALVDQMNSVTEAAVRANDTLFRVSDDIAALPENLQQKFQQIQDGLDRIGIHPDLFQPSAKISLSGVKSRQDALKNTPLTNPAAASTGGAPAASPAAQEASNSTYSDEVVSPPTTRGGAAGLGTASTTGDVLSAKSRVSVGGTVVAYTGSKRVSVGQGDTLTNLAARYLGDARLWQHIAVLNGLKPPFLSEMANRDLTAEESVFSNALGIGDQIQIPTFAKAPKSLPILPVLGVRPEKSIEDHILGTDVALEMVSGRLGAPLYDIPVDTDGGSVDVKVVRGVQNISQAVILRLRTERGTDTMFKSVGLARVIGFNIVPIDLELAKFRVAEALLQDQRIASVRNINFETGQQDALVVDATVELRGFTESATVKARV